MITREQLEAANRFWNKHKRPPRGATIHSGC
jgi:hypothetical protein